MPAAICFAHLFDSPVAEDTRGTLVSPFSGGYQASFAAPKANTGPIVPIDILSNNDLLHRYQATTLVNTVTSAAPGSSATGTQARGLQGE